MSMEFDTDGIFEIRKDGKEIRLIFTTEDKAMKSYWKFFTANEIVIDF